MLLRVTSGNFSSTLYISAWDPVRVRFGESWKVCVSRPLFCRRMSGCPAVLASLMEHWATVDLLRLSQKKDHLILTAVDHASPVFGDFRKFP